MTELDDELDAMDDVPVAEVDTDLAVKRQLFAMLFDAHAKLSCYGERKSLVCESG